MICEPVFEDRGSLTSLLQRAEARFIAGERVPDLELAVIIEMCRGEALPAAITDYLTQHFRGEIKGVKGPKLQSQATKDFRFGPAYHLYRHVLRIFEYLAKRPKPSSRRRRIVNPKPGPRYQDQTLPPSVRALEYVIAKPPKDEECNLGSISIKSIANEFSKLRRAIEDREFPDDEPNAHPTDAQEASRSAIDH